MTACDTDTISTAVQIVQAVEDGHDVRGITMWTLIDNFEWACEIFFVSSRFIPFISVCPVPSLRLAMSDDGHW